MTGSGENIVQFCVYDEEPRTRIFYAEEILLIALVDIGV